MITIVLSLIVGGALGWLVSLGMQITTQQGVQIDAERELLLTMGVGLVGAFLGTVLFHLLMDDGFTLAARTFSLGALFVAFSGAVLLLVIVIIVPRRTVGSS